VPGRLHPGFGCIPPSCGRPGSRGAAIIRGRDEMKGRGQRCAWRRHRHCAWAPRASREIPCWSRNPFNGGTTGSIRAANPLNEQRLSPARCSHIVRCNILSPAVIVSRSGSNRDPRAARIWSIARPCLADCTHAPSAATDVPRASPHIAMICRQHRCRDPRRICICSGQPYPRVRVC
jgi:hypothetical protein